MAFDVYLLAFAKSLLFSLATILPILNPPGTSPMFLSMTEGATDATRAALAARVARNIFIMLMAAMLVGSLVLDFFGISLPIVRVGGGLLVVSAAWRLLTTDDSSNTTSVKLVEAFTPEVGRRKAFYPLTFPISCGPGSLAAAITVGVTLHDSSVALSASRLIGAMFGVALLSLIAFLCFRFAVQVLRPLGETGTIVMLRMSAFILLCLGVQIVWDGASELILSILQRAA